jgi:hypothetical protein
MPTPPASDAVRDRARLLARVVEPVVGQVYFAQECHDRYAALGFNPSPGRFGGDVAIPDGAAYFTSRGSALGQVPGEVVAAAFGVFNPAAVVPAVAHGWTLTDAATIADQRLQGAIEQLTRILGPKPEGVDRAVDLLHRATDHLQPAGRSLFAGVLSQPLPGEPLGDLFRLGDRLREYRGDCHIAVWVGEGFDAVEIGLLTELSWGMPSRSYIRTRAWSDADLDAAEARLEAAGLMADHELTPAGRERREELELSTDAAMAPVLDALGDDVDELCTLLRDWSEQIMRAGGYPESPLALAPRR